MMVSGGEHILLVTSDEIFGRTMEKHLKDHGYKVAMAGSAASGVESARCMTPRLVLVDQRECGIDKLRRETGLRKVPVIGLQPPGQNCNEEQSLMDVETDLVDMALCNKTYRQMIAQIRSVLRREHLGLRSNSRYEVGKLHVDVDRYEVTVDGRAVDLTPKEFRILQQMAAFPSKVFSRDELLSQVWGEDCALEEHTLDVHIHSLRHKIEPDPANPSFIITVRGVGYKLKSPG